MFDLKLLKVVFAMVAVLIFAVSSVTTTVYAQGKGRGQKGRPPGWDRGEKEDWTSDVPPGQEESGPPGWKEGEKKGWFSDVPPGLGKKEGEWIPPGWSKGEKEDWMGASPPGWENKNKEEKKEWESKLKVAKESIKKKGKKLGFSDEEIDQASESLEISSKVGVPIEDAAKIVQNAMDKGMGGPEIEKLTRAVSYGVGREIKFDQLGDFVNEKFEEGLRDEELSLEIYKEVQGRQEKKAKARKTIQEEKKKEKQSK